MTQWTVARLLARTTEFLAGKGSTSPRLDAELLLAETLGVERITLYTGPERPLTSGELDAYRALVARRARREPVAYILGRAHFRYLTLEVTPAVLIPRPETEELVDVVRAWLEERPPLPPPAWAPPGTAPAGPLVADVGTGSGAIALSLAREAGVRVMATDASPQALEVAARNRDALGLTGMVELRLRDLLDGVPDASLRVVVSNPPYIADDEYEGLAPDVRLYEPAAALRAGPGGLDVYRRLVPQAFAALGPGGALFVEVGLGQAQSVADLAAAAGFCAVAVLPDLSGRDRMVRAVRPGALRIPLDAVEVDEAAAAGDDGLGHPPGDGEAPTAGAGPAIRLDAMRAALEAGAIIGLPTDTVYGLAAAWDSPRGVRRLFEAKGRGEERPVQVLFSSVQAVAAALPDLDPRGRRVLEALLPGPYTFVLGSTVPRPRHVGTADSLGVRVPEHPGLLRFLRALGIPLAATSANRSGMPDAATVDDADPEVLAACALALVPGGPSPGAGGPVPGDAASAPVGRASTVVDLRPLAGGGAVEVLREGVVPAEQVRARVAALFEG